MISNSFLNKAYVENPPHHEYNWGYHTFGYGFSITFFSRLEVSYICTIFNGDWSPYAKSYRAKIMKNQDRHFAARVQALKEGEFGWKWMPSVVLGLSDPVTGSGSGEYFDDNVGSESNLLQPLPHCCCKAFRHSCWRFWCSRCLSIYPQKVHHPQRSLCGRDLESRVAESSGLFPEFLPRDSRV